ncbi:hypothetical protein [Terrimonas alba]|uniref:hypothetical protein n=1 Tax=Terrimonas alba TaxID=3349636 RepID=UPI0035F4EF72
MRKITSLILLLAIATSAFSQHVEPATVQPRRDYLRKSKTQKTFAWILTGVGVTAVTIGLLTQDYVDAFTSIAEEKNSSSPAVYAVGGACIAGGIVLFIASSKNKRKANAIHAFFRMEKITEPRISIAGNTRYPALGLRLRWQ